MMIRAGGYVNGLSLQNREVVPVNCKLLRYGRSPWNRELRAFERPKRWCGRSRSFWLSTRAADDETGPHEAPGPEEPEEVSSEVSSEVVFGPRGILLLGFNEEDGSKVDRWFQKMEPGFVVSYASEELMSQKLSDIVLGHDGSFRRHHYQNPPSGILGPLVLMSGMCWEEVTGILEFWHQTGLDYVPNVASVLEHWMERPLQQLCDHVTRQTRLQEKEATGSPKWDKTSLQAALKRTMELRRDSGQSGPINIDIDVPKQTQNGFSTENAIEAAPTAAARRAFPTPETRPPSHSPPPPVFKGFGPPPRGST